MPTAPRQTCRPIGDCPPWVSQRLFPFASRYADVGGCRIHYIDEGRGPTLLLLHGNPTWSFLYRDVVRVLRGEFRCVALDYPGFGLSRAPRGYGYTPEEHAQVVEGFVVQQDLGPYTPFCHDWGGPIGLAVAGRNPERVEAVVIGNTFAWPIAGTWHFEWFTRLFGGPIGRVAIRRWNAFVNLLLPAGTRRGSLGREEMEHYRRPLATPTAREPTWMLPRAMRTSTGFLAQVEAALPRLRQLPALIVWGDRDIAFRAVERRRFERAFPRSTVVDLRGARHFIQEDAPDRIAAAVRAWWPVR